MPVSDHVVNERKGFGGEDVSSHGQAVRKAEGGRRCVPINLDDTSSGILSPILSHLPSLSGISNLKSFLPASPSSSSQVSSLEVPKAIWQEADLGDGKGKCRLLLLSTSTHALQCFRYEASVIPNDPHVPESFSAPEEVFSLPRVHYDSSTVKTALEGADVFVGQGKVLTARLLVGGPLWKKHGPVIAFITLMSQRKSSQGSLALVIASLRSGTAIYHVSLGFGSTAGLAVSARALAVSVAHPIPAIHLLDPHNLAPLGAPIAPLPADPTTSLPVFSLSGRLLAYATSSPPARTGPDGLGSLVTAKSTLRSRPTPHSGSGTGTQSRSVSDTAQGALFTSAVEIGGGVARGVWAGIKMGARAANQARNSRLARSAPAEASGSLADEEREDDETESKSAEEASVMEEAVGPEVEERGDWVQVIDLGRMAGDRPTETTKRSGSDASSKLPVVAHFRSPSSRVVAPLPAQSVDQRLSLHSRQAVSYLSFNALGTQLVVAPADGRVLHIFEISPSGAARTAFGVAGEVWHLYELRRGNTAGAVCEVKWSQDGRWVGVGTGRGTIHMFPVNPTGGAAAARSHVSSRNINPQELYPLSTIATASSRLRPSHIETADEPESVARKDGPGAFALGDVRTHALDNKSVCQDILVFRPASIQIELMRLTTQAVQLPAPTTRNLPGQRRASALTEMMRAKTFGEGSDLDVKKALKAKWAVPLGTGHSDTPLLAPKALPQTASTLQTTNLAHAEIHTYCTHPKILPGTIYLSAQVNFYAARPIDDFSPLSIMDLEARTKRLIYRPQVEARPTSPEVKSFDEPLLSALHSVIESPSNGEIPGLPNGHPGATRWRSIPIRHVAAGLGEGVDRVRREYAKAQHTRAKRRASMAAHNGLSFEEETIFAAQEHDDDEASSPSSALMPTTNTESSGEADDDEWAVGWEEEYARAVEEDGGPEELVLGLMDEEQEERRKWAEKQRERYMGTGQK